MQVPRRKAGKYGTLKDDPVMTAAKFAVLQKKLEELKEKTRPRAMEEVAKHAALGDLSENAAYTIAKGKLRGINSMIEKLENQIKHAVIIQKQDSDEVGIGSTVTLEYEGKILKYQILGSSETDPGHGVISHSSPLGKTLMGHRTGDEISVPLGIKKNHYTIIRIE